MARSSLRGLSPSGLGSLEVRERGPGGEQRTRGGDSLEGRARNGLSGEGGESPERADSGGRQAGQRGLRGRGGRRTDS